MLNSLYVDGAACAEAVLGKAAEVVAAMPGFDELFGSLVREQAEQLDRGRVAERQKIESEIRQLERQQAIFWQRSRTGLQTPRWSRNSIRSRSLSIRRGFACMRWTPSASGVGDASC